jgi:MYXO-CTERM domain-containing protein
MDITTLSLLSAMAMTGYGEVVDGQPSWSQRELHVYTNLVRVDPESWSDEYPCEYSGFTAEEKTAQAPLYYHDGLTEIAQSHSQDMFSNDFMAHESFDGTDFGTRVWPWYDGTMIGENVAYGYVDNWDVVFEGWMCSAGHRSNIMAADFEDIGTGVINRSYTQDFGAGAGTPHIQIAMGIHLPEVPTRQVEFMVTYEDDEAPGGVWVETHSSCHSMEHMAGSGDRGAYRVEVESEDDCVPYRFTWESGSGIGGVLPETGAYVYGDGCPEWTDEEPTGCTTQEEESSEDPDNDDDGGSSDGDGSSDGESESDSDAPTGQRDSDCPGGVASCIENESNEPLEGKACSTAPGRPAEGLMLLGIAALIGRLRRRD